MLSMQSLLDSAPKSSIKLTETYLKFEFDSGVLNKIKIELELSTA